MREDLFQPDNQGTCVQYVPPPSKEQFDYLPSLQHFNADEFLSVRKEMPDGCHIKVGESITIHAIPNKRKRRARFHLHPLYEGHRGLIFAYDTTLWHVISKASKLLAQKAQEAFDFITDGSTISYRPADQPSN